MKAEYRSSQVRSVWAPARWNSLALYAVPPGLVLACRYGDCKRQRGAVQKGKLEGQADQMMEIGESLVGS